MDRSDSDFQILDTDNQSEAIGFLSSLLFKEKVEENDHKYCERTNHIFVNGVGEDSYVEDEEFEGSVEKDLIRALKFVAQTELEARVAKHLALKAEDEARQKAADMERQRQADLRLLEDLKKKLGVV